MGTSLGDYIGANYYRDPFPHSLLSTRDFFVGFWLQNREQRDSGLRGDGNRRSFKCRRQFTAYWLRVQGLGFIGFMGLGFRA